MIKKLKVSFIVLILAIVAVSVINIFNNNSSSVAKASTNVKNNETETNFNVEEINNIDKIIKNKIKDFDPNLEWSMVLMNSNNGHIIYSYGDIDELYEPGTPFKALITSTLIENNNLNLDSKVDNTPYKYKDLMIGSWYGNKSYQDKVTFRDNFVNINNPILFREYEKINKEEFISNLKKYNIELDIKANEAPLFLIGENVKISSKNLAFAYSAMNNGGTLLGIEPTEIISEQTSNQMQQLLYDTSNNRLWWKNDLFNKYKISGLFGSMAKSDYVNTNFAGFASSDSTNLTLVLNIKSNLDNTINISDISPLVSDIVNYSLENYSLKTIDDISFFEQNNKSIVYWGRLTFVKCVIVEPILKQISLEKGINIYYFNTDEWREDSNFNSILSKFKVENVPYLITTKNVELM